MDKKSKNTLIVSIIALALVLIGVTYAYFSARITGLESASTISLTAGQMRIHYAEGDENVIMNNIYPREEAWVTKTFTLTGWNTTDQEMKYEIGLNVTSNTFTNGYLTYDLRLVSSTNGTPVQTKTGISINGTGRIRFGRGAFANSDGDSHNYELKIYFKDNGEDQNDAQEALLNANIYINEYVPKSLEVSTVVEENGLISFDIDETKCNTFLTNDWSYTAEEASTLCSGGTYVYTWRIGDGIYDADLIQAGAIINPVYDNPANEDPVLISYDIDTNVCKNYLVYNMSHTPDEATNLCSGGTYVWNWKIGDGQSDDMLIQEEVIINPVYGTVVVDRGLTVGFRVVSGPYTYLYNYVELTQWDDYTSGVILDGWSVFLTDKESTASVIEAPYAYINGKPVTSMAQMFYGSQAASIDLSSFDTKNVTDMKGMFGRTVVSSLDLVPIDTSNVTNMYGMFENSDATSLNLNSFDTSNVTDMSWMFNSSKATSLDLSSFDTSNVTGMSYMFFNTVTADLDLSGFDTSKVINMRYMFGSSQAVSIDLSSFDTSRVTLMADMFNNCTNLTTIYASEDFVTTALLSGFYAGNNYIFRGSTSLIGGAGTTYNSSFVDKTYAHIDGGPSNPGYFTAKTN